MTEEEFQGTRAILGAAHGALGEALQTAAALRFPALKNVTPGAPLGPMLLSRPLVPCIFVRGNSLDGDLIGQFMAQLAEVLDRAQRVHFKSLGGILALQEKIAEQWLAAAKEEPGVTAGPGGEQGIPLATRTGRPRRQARFSFAAGRRVRYAREVV